MELVFDLVGSRAHAPGLLTQKTFRHVGGLIGRSEDCDWYLPDPQRVLSSQHARISYSEGDYFLTDLSSNGIQLADGQRLTKGEPWRIQHGQTFALGTFALAARLIRDPAGFADDFQVPASAPGLIPDDAFLELDPLQALERRDPHGLDEFDGFDPLGSDSTRSDYARVDLDSLGIPALVEHTAPAPVERPAAAPQQQTPAFWKAFGAALGLELADLDHEARETLALEVARLLRLATQGLHGCLRTRNETRNELRLPLTTVQSSGNNPLAFAADGDAALSQLLRPSASGQLTADQALLRACRELQAHQVGLVAASRQAVLATLEQLAPAQCEARLERDGRRPRWGRDARLWRAWQRQYRELRQDDDWRERLFAKDFAQAYTEQVRLIATLNPTQQGR
ncbi:type VI secretion system-associated FHA domain protein TagH [Pseudomonas oryzihabitans]|uniref:type VI secretion system-associated FHA domain protein TagH n=1 Tax=Pseudomonas oryzihabitans TaxID=47885 RepID=UPI003F97AC2A